MKTAVPLSDVIWHEECEPRRLEGVISALRNEPIREPVHVSQDDERRVILDGAHRCQASHLLGCDSVPAHLVPLPDDTPVPGWVHVLPPDAQVQIPSAKGPIVATLVQGDTALAVRATAADSYSVWKACWSLMRQYECSRYERRHTPDKARPSIVWHPPRWGVIRATAAQLGPFPPGITRLGELIAARCQACSTAI